MQPTSSPIGKQTEHTQLQPPTMRHDTRLRIEYTAPGQDPSAPSARNTFALNGSPATELFPGASAGDIAGRSIAAQGRIDFAPASTRASSPEANPRSAIGKQTRRTHAPTS
jgi:hypothetical protein